MVNKVDVKVKSVLGTAVLPVYETDGAACFDLTVAEDSPLLMPGEVVALTTGLIFEIPEGYKMMIYPRSGVSKDTVIRIANTPGVIDSDYRGEVKILVQNTGVSMLKISAGERLAQGEIVPVTKAEFSIVGAVTVTKRGAGGFGSTGKGQDDKE